VKIAIRQLASLGLIITAGAGAAPACLAQSAGVVPESPGIKFDAYGEISYNRLSGTGVFASEVADRVFDVDNGWSLQRIGTSGEYLPSQGFGGRFDLNFGKDSIGMAPMESYPGTSKVDLTQAFAQYAADGYTVMAGKLIALVGAEYLQSPSNLNFSRSILFGFATPFTHVGVRTAFFPTEHVTLYAGMNNGWDHMPGRNSLRTMELGITANRGRFDLSATGYIGMEPTGDSADPGRIGRRTLVDVVAAWRATKSLSITLNCDWAMQRNVAGAGQAGRVARWSGQALYVNYSISERLTVGWRAESFSDPNGFRTGIAQHWRELTGTVNLRLSKHLEVRAELRRDFSDGRVFMHELDAQSTQDSAGIQLLVKL
jgi:hypothetical protein